LIHPSARAELLPLVREYRAAELRHRELSRRLGAAERNIARDAFNLHFVVARAVIASRFMASQARVAALREALRLAQRRP
jgi:hypothetical protein